LRVEATIVKKGILLAVFIVTACMSSVAVSFWQNNHLKRCSLDGSQIASFYEVTITYNDETEKHFSCILSAQLWLDENRGSIESIMVTDEVAGEKIGSKKAFFVASNVVTNSFTGNKIHVFKDKTEAMFHAKKNNGTLITCPFQIKEPDPVFFVISSTAGPNSTDIFSPFSQKPFVLPDNKVSKNPQNSCYLNKEFSFRCCAGYPARYYKPPKHT
jgi:hypothetical protein